MAEDSGQSVLPIIVEDVVPLFPGLHERLTVGIDVLDVGCGKGLALMRLAAAYPNSRFVGYDLSEEITALASAEAAARGLLNLTFQQKDLTHWNEEQAFDWITAFDAIHDQARPDLVLGAIRKALRPGGWFLMQDIDASSEPLDNRDHPLGSVFYTISCMHCMTVSLAQGGMGLGTAWGVQLAERMLREAGFSEVKIHRFPHDIQNAYFLIPA
jgi:2-polyprenyl-3-methyl-5-hydroxy-6-metoxy-1,4-benzoquinol methylase